MRTVSYTHLNPDEYVSVSAFSPIVSPSQVPWGQQAFAAYLGENKDAWLYYDPVSLIDVYKRQLMRTPPVAQIRGLKHIRAWR